MTKFDLPEKFARFYETVKDAFQKTRVVQAVKDRSLTGYPPSQDHPVWLRDHTYQMRGFRFFEPDLKSAVEVFAQTQGNDGCVYDHYDKEGKGTRVDVEADVEYLLVEAAYLAWQGTGDKKWLAGLLPNLEKAMAYSMGNGNRWSKKHRLVKRPFTLDTWDFVYNPDGIYNQRPHQAIDKDTKFCIMHGDNSGMYKSSCRLAFMYRRLGNAGRAKYWDGIAKDFLKRTNNLCWNGHFYTHQIHIDPVTIEGVEESRQLSLSNAFNLNRGIADFNQRCSIIEEYIRRRDEKKDSFAEWYGIHPPFPDYSFNGREFPPEWSINAYSYVNGGILPLVGGELARGAFENGFEEYGMDILDRYFNLLDTVGPYVWYYPDKKPGLSFTPPDVWGLSAMFAAMLEGLVGVKDKDSLFKRVSFSPRLLVAGIADGSATIEYAASGANFSYEYSLDQKKNILTLKYSGNNIREVSCHVLLPPGMKAVKVTQSRKPLPFKNETLRKSPYVNFTTPGKGNISIVFKKIL